MVHFVHPEKRLARFHSLLLRQKNPHVEHIRFASFRICASIRVMILPLCEIFLAITIERMLTGLVLSGCIDERREAVLKASVHAGK